MKKIICIIDNDFDKTLPVVRGIALYRTKLRKDIKRSYKIIFCHICPFSNDDEEEKYCDNEKKNIKQFANKTKDFKELSKLIETKYAMIRVKLDSPRNIEEESSRIVRQVEEVIMRETRWKKYQENNVLYLLDLALEFITSDSKGNEDTRPWLGRGVYKLLEGKRVKLFTTYSDGENMFEKFCESYKDEYATELQYSDIVMSRSALNPREFKLSYGEKILEWD